MPPWAKTLDCVFAFWIDEMLVGAALGETLVGCAEDPG